MMGLILMGVFGLLLPVLKEHSLPAWPWFFGLSFSALALIKPSWLKYLYIPWMKVGAVLGWINTRIILGLIFFCLMTPMALVMRLMGKDPMQRRYDPTLNSYRKKSNVLPIKHMEKPF